MKSVAKLIREEGRTLLLIAAVILLFFPEIALLKKGFVSGDHRVQHYPWFYLSIVRREGRAGHNQGQARLLFGMDSSGVTAIDGFEGLMIQFRVLAGNKNFSVEQFVTTNLTPFN